MARCASSDVSNFTILLDKKDEEMCELDRQYLIHNTSDCVQDVLYFKKEVKIEIEQLLTPILVGSHRA
jgi:hypothetical protein